MIDDINLFNVIHTNRSIRKYKPESISKSDIEIILKAGISAPSGGNRQKFRFIVIQDSDFSKNIKNILRNGYQLGLNKIKNYITFESTQKGIKELEAINYMINNFNSIPLIILVCFIRDGEPTQYEGASVYPACQNILLASRGLGYGSLMSMWHLEVEEELRKELLIPDNVTMSACITIGKPVGKHGPLNRKPINKIAFKEYWMNPYESNK